MESGISTSRSAAASADVLCLVFRVGNRLCALPLSAVVEIMRPLPTEPFAHAPPGVQGMAIVRGVALPVVALAYLFDAGTPIRHDRGRPARFITVRNGERQLALAVGAVIGVEPMASTTLQRLPSLLGAANAGAVQALGAVDTELLLLLDAARLVESVTAAMVSVERS